MTQEMGEFAEAYRLSALTDEGTPPPENEGQLLVTVGDGKGVVMRKTLAQRMQECSPAHRTAGYHLRGSGTRKADYGLAVS